MGKIVFLQTSTINTHLKEKNNTQTSMITKNTRKYRLQYKEEKIDTQNLMAHEKRALTQNGREVTNIFIKV